MSLFIRNAILLLLTFIVFIGTDASARDLKASIAKMPVYAESKDKGVLVDLVRAIAEVSGNNIEIEISPFKLSMFLAKIGKADFHLPLIKNPVIKEDTLDYDHSTESIFHVNFVLYSNKNKEINKDSLKDYYIETDAAHVEYFDFKIYPSPKIKTSLTKVDEGRIDGFIFADAASDPLIREYNLKNIKRQLYKVFEVKIILPKGGRGGEIDGILTSAIKKLRESGRYEEIMKPVDYPYNDWQP